MNSSKICFVLCVIFDLAFSRTLLSADDQCDSNNVCNYPNGDCLRNRCVCRLYYDGSHCDDDWRNDKSWMAAFTFFYIWEITMQSICLVAGAYELYKTLKYSQEGRWAKWSLTTWMIILVITAALIRVVFYSIDPYHYRGIIHPIADDFAFTFPILMWVAMGFMMFLYWLELTQLTGIKELLFVVKYRASFIIYVGSCFTIAIPLAIWNFVANDPLSGIIYGVFQSVMVASQIVLLTGSGLKLVHVIRTTFKSLDTSQTGVKGFLRQLIYYIIALDILLTGCVLGLIIYQLIGAQFDRWRYVAMHLILRTFEFGIVISCLWFIKKKKPKKTNLAPASEKLYTITDTIGNEMEREMSNLSEPQTV